MIQALTTYALLVAGASKLNCEPYPNNIKEGFEDPRNGENMKWSVVPTREAVVCAAVIMYGSTCICGAFDPDLQAQRNACQQL
jgi:hypothetical protein